MLRAPERIRHSANGMPSSQGDAADPPVTGSAAAGLGCYFRPAQRDGQPAPGPQGASSAHSPRRRHEVRRERQGRVPLRPRRAGQRQRELGQVHGGGQPDQGAQGGGRQAAGPAPGQRQQAAAGGERAGEGPDAQRQHGLHGAAHPHSHRAGRPQAVQDRDAAPGLQLHLAPGQRAAARGGQPRRPALPAVPQHHQPHAQAHLHFLSQQPEENGQRWGKALVCLS